MDIETARYLISAIIQATAIAYGVVLAIYMYYIKTLDDTGLPFVPDDESINYVEWHIRAFKKLIIAMWSATFTIIFGILTLTLASFTDEGMLPMFGLTVILALITFGLLMAFGGLPIFLFISELRDYTKQLKRQKKGRR